MCAQTNVAPVIIKRKKRMAGDSHHGGAWKVAYADFVTAMMAFFLLMWLLNATTEKQRKGIADYFSPTIPLSRVSGGGESVLSGGRSVSDAVTPDPELGDHDRPARVQPAAVPGDGLPKADQTAMTAVLEKTERRLSKALFSRGGNNLYGENILRHVNLRRSDEGLVIEMFEHPGQPLFERDQVSLTPLGQQVAAVLADVSRLVSNPIAIEGHVSTGAVVLADYPVWELSSGRAVALKQVMLNAGFNEARIARLTGHADREPAVSNTMSARNDRIEIVFLNSRPTEIR